MTSKHVKFGEKMVTIMGLKGMPDDGGKDWILDIPVTGDRNDGYILVQVSPIDPSVVSSIEEVIENDRKAGREELIDHVLISNRYAVCLYPEGRLTRDVLANAKTEGETLVFNMFLGGKDRKVIVKNEYDLEYACGTYQANGELV